MRTLTFEEKVLVSAEASTGCIVVKRNGDELLRFAATEDLITLERLRGVIEWDYTWSVTTHPTADRKCSKVRVGLLSGLAWIVLYHDKGLWLCGRDDLNSQK